MSKVPMPADLNARHREFWANQALNLKERVNKPHLADFVVERMRRDYSPINMRYSFEYEIAEADLFATNVRKSSASHAGRSRRPDALQDLIVSIVQNNPHITLERLRRKLELESGGEVIQEIVDSKIYYTERRNNRDSTRSAPISGLKDRLTRARRTVGLAPTR